MATGQGHPEIMYKGEDAPAQPPVGLNWLMGWGTWRGNGPTWSVPTRPLAEGAPRVRGWE